MEQMNELNDSLITLCKEIAIDRASNVANRMLEYEKEEGRQMNPKLAVYAHNMVWAFEMEVVLKHLVTKDDEMESGRKAVIDSWFKIHKDILEYF